MAYNQLSTTTKTLQNAQYINITTFRKTGVPLPTPVWFAHDHDVLYVETAGNSGKVKRIRHTPRVLVAPCTASGKVTGAVIEGRARVVNNVAEQFKAKAALHHKYSWKRQLLYSFMEIIRIARRQPATSDAYIAVEFE